MLEPILFGSKILFLVLLYLFIFHDRTAPVA